ncbi:MAG: DUF1735 domain-containing protein, partial [Chitinophagaceae bacterium]
MKKVLKPYKRAALFCLLAMTALVSCKKDDGLSSRELLVYVAGDYSRVDNRVVTPFVHNPVSITGSRMTGFAAYATREVPADIDVTFTADASLVADFNQKNGTAFLPLPAANYRIVNPGKYKIKAGTVKSDSLQIEILNPGQLTDPKGYLLPFTITAIEGQDKGAAISTNQRTVYLNVTYEFNNVLPGQAPAAGTAMSRTGWSVTVSNTTSGALGPAMIDGNNSTAWRSSNTASAAKWAIVNIASQKTVSSFLMVPNYVTTTENATQITVSSSNDNTNWTVQGIWRGTGPATGTTAAAPDVKGINFASPVTAQYFRLEINTWVS